MTRRFVQLDEHGVVFADIECERETWDDVIIPSQLIDVTGVQEWKGLGSLHGHRRLPTGAFVPPSPTPATGSPSVTDRLAALETAIEAIRRKMGA